VIDWVAQLALALVAMLPVSGNSFEEEPVAPGEPHIWHTDYRQARKIARESGKPLFVVFRCQH
jgi:hypothetical protein